MTGVLATDRMAPATVRIAVVIVTYNSAAVLDGCLESLRAGAHGVHLTDVMIADNASRDTTLRIAASYQDTPALNQHPGGPQSGAVAAVAAGLPIQTVQLGRNAGYAAAFNAGVRALDGRPFDAVLILNPDCRLRPGSLARLAAALNAPSRGIAVPRLIDPHGGLYPSLRREPTVSGAFAEAVVGGPLASRLGQLGEIIFDPRAYDRPRPAIWATGAAMLISAAALRDTGPWDETYLLYSEETEFALRAGDRGWTLWYEPAAVIEHIGGELATNPMLAALLMVNKVRLFRQRRGCLPSAAYFSAVLLGQGIRALAGRRISWASFVALTRPSRRVRGLPT